MKKIITEEISRIKEIMYEKSLINESFIGVLSRNAVTNAVRASITTVMDDFVKNALKIGTKTAIGDARYVVDDIIKGGAQGAMKVAATANKVYDDVAKAAFGKSYNSLDENTRLMIRNNVRQTLDETNDDILKAAKNASDDLDNFGKPKPVDGGGGGKPTVVDGGGGGTMRPTWYKPIWNWTTKTTWGRILLGAATLTAAYLAWRKIWGGDDDLPLCLKGLIKNEEDFNRFLENKYISTGSYRFYAEGNKVLVMFPGGESDEGKWEYDEDNKIIKLDFGGNLDTTIPCEDVLPSPDECPPGYDKNLTTGECEKKGGGGGGGGGGSYKNCTDFPFIKFCKNTKIAEVQKCLGGLVSDGKFGPKTEAALEKAGYGIDISEDDYNKIIQKCKGVQPSPETTQPPLDTTGDMSNKPE